MKTQIRLTYCAALLLAITTAGLAQTASKKTPPPAPTGNGWSGASAISPLCQPDPTRGSQLNDMAVNASGAAIAAWDQYTYNFGFNASIGVATQSGGKWAAPFTITGINGSSLSPRVAIGADGTMAVSWTYQDPATQPTPQQQKIQVAVKPAGSTTWTTTTLAQGIVGGVAITQLVPIAVDANGNVTAVWSLWNGAIHVVQSATLPKGGSWTAPVTLAPGLDGMYPCLALNARGDAAVAYTISAYAYGTGTSAQYVYRPGLNGPWTSPVIVSEILSSSIGYVSSPLVALDANGLATVAYFSYGVEAVRQLSAGTWTMPQVVLASPASGSSFGSIDLGADQNGNAVLACYIFDATIGVDRASVYVSIGTPAGAWSPQQRLTDPTVPIDAYAPRVAVSPDGGLVLVGWIDHYHGNVQVSKLVHGVWGGANTIGRGTAFSSFQEILTLDAASSTIARAIWKNARGGTQTMSSSFGK